jgi:thioredoxin 1
MATMSVERICSSHGAMAMPRAAAVARVQGAASTVSMVGCRRSSAGVLVSQSARFGERRAEMARGSSPSLVCRSSVRPLSDSNGNVGEFQSEEEFNKILTEAGDKLVVVDISTTTCGPCKMIFPKLVEMSLEYPDAVFLKINGDINNDTRTLMRKWGVRAVPNFRFFKNGEQVHSHTGAKLDELKTRFAEHYGQPIKV